MGDRIAVIVSRWHADDPSRRALEESVEAALADRADIELTIVPDLYDLTPDGPAVGRLRSIAGEMIVLAWGYPRSAYWIMSGDGVEGRLGVDSAAEETSKASSERTIWCLDLGSFDSAEEIAKEVGRIAATLCKPSGEAATAAATARSDEAVESRWYPVIDWDRCTNCLECLNFCLFGVFASDESDSLVIEEPDACRDGCPACSRICPAGAIMFPRHADPSIAGDPDASLTGMKLDLSQLFAGLDPASLAAGERDRALIEKPLARPPSNTNLDHLIDEVDEMEL